MRLPSILTRNPAARRASRSIRAGLALLLLAGPLALTGCGSIRVPDTRGAAQAPGIEDVARRWGTAADPTAAMPLVPSGVPTDKTTVALLLPLSGQHAPIGQAMLNAAQLAVFDVGGENFVLLPKDTRGTPEGAAAAASDAISQGAQLILGPLLSTSVAAVADATRGSRVNMIAFSNDASVAGDGVYLLGFLPGAEVQRVVAYAKSQGLQRFGVLAPDSAYGRLVAAAMENAVGRQGGVLSRVAFLSPGADMAEVQQTTKQLADEPGRAGLQTGIAGVRPFDALMLPIGGQQLSLVASLLQYNGVDPAEVRFLGTGQWANQPDLGAEPALVGGWFAAPAPDARTPFVNRYVESYGMQPPRIATLAYDATTLAAALATQPGGFERPRLTDTSGFYGADGLFRFQPDGTAERGLAVLEVTRDGLIVVDPAPQRFDDVIY